MWYFVSLYLQDVLGFTPIEAGLAFLPMTGAIILTSSFAGRGVGRIGAGRMLVVGMALIAVGMALFARVAVDGTLGGRRPRPGRADGLRARALVRPRDDRGGQRRGAHRGRARLGPGQHRPPGRRLAGPGGAGHAGDPAHGRPGPGGAAQDAALTGGFHRAFLVGAGFAAVGSVAALLLLVRGVPAAAPEPAEAPERAAA